MLISYKNFNAKMAERQEKQLEERYKSQKERIFKLYSNAKNIDELLSFTAQNRTVPHPEEGCLCAIDVCKDIFKSKKIDNMYLTSVGSALIKYIINCGDFSCDNLDNFFMCYDEYQNAVTSMNENNNSILNKMFSNRCKLLKMTCNDFFSNYIRVQESLVAFNISKHIVPAISDYLLSVSPDIFDKELEDIKKELKTLGYYDKIDEILLAVKSKKASDPNKIFGLSNDRDITDD